VADLLLDKVMLQDAWCRMQGQERGEHISEEEAGSFKDPPDEVSHISEALYTETEEGHSAPVSRMLKKSAGFVLASLPGTVKRGSPAELWPCLGKGASWRAGVGRMRRLAFLSILQDCSPIGPHE
jgi:hypothetical protein